LFQDDFNLAIAIKISHVRGEFSSTPEEWSTLRNGAIVSAAVVPDNSPIFEDRHLVHDDQLTAPSRSRVPFQEAGRAPIVETIPRAQAHVFGL
jgi:hypothetical protein